MNLFTWPYMKIEDHWTIPDKIVLAVWNKIVDLDRVKPTWYDGSVKNEHEFFAFMRDPYIYPAIIAGADKVHLWALAWLSDMVDGTARAHFCFLDRYNKEIADEVLDYWKRLDSFRVVIGITPESYKLVLKIIQRSGFEIVGTIPQICNMRYEDRIEGGVISYYLIKGEENGGQKQS